MKKIKLMQVYKAFHPDIFGGIPYVMDIISKVRVNDIDHSIFVCSSKPSQTNQNFVFRVKSWGNLLSLPIAPSFPFNFCAFLRKVNIVLLHSPFPLADLAFAFASKRSIRLIVFWHADITRQRWLVPFVRPFIMRTLELAECIVVSSAILASQSSLLHKFQSKCVELPIPIDPKKIELSEHEEQIVKSLRTKYGRFVFACGRLVAYKGFDILIHAAREINQSVVIAGDGPERKRLERMIENLGLHNVFLLGSLDERQLVFHYHAAKVFVLPSVNRAEAFGIVQLEAMAAGIPIVNTMLPTAVPQVARHELEALTVEPSNPEALAAAINMILGNLQLAKRLGSAGRERILNDFSMRLFVEKIETILKLPPEKRDKSS